MLSGTGPWNLNGADSVTDDASSPGGAFIDRSRAYLKGEYLPKIRRCLAELSGEDLWWRPNPASNSVGNLILHLAGNIRQWVTSGIGGEPDHRDRSGEFSAEGGYERATLLELLETTIRDVDRTLERLDTETLLERRVIQGLDVTVLDALYHAVEHFSGHTAQIVYVTKLRTGSDLAFYEVEGGIARARW